MNVQEFQAKWRDTRLKESAGAQEHFIDLFRKARPSDGVERYVRHWTLNIWPISDFGTSLTDEGSVESRGQKGILHMEKAKDTIRRTLADAKVYLSQDSPRKISEADTKANFIEPIVAALGWEGIGVVTREYYVKDSQEFIDYVMSGASGPLLAIEAKSLQAPLTDKNAAQLIQYCAVEGIEWAALTNGRELQFFNTFLKPDLSAKRILQLDLLAFNTEAEYEALFENLWQLSRESMTTSTGVRTWLHQRRLDKALRDVLLNPASSTVKYLRKTLSAAEVSASPQEISQWFRSHLHTASSSVPLPDETQISQLAGSLSGASTSTSDTSHADVSSQNNGKIDHLFGLLKERVNRRWGDTQWREKKHYWAAAVNNQTFLAVKFRSGKLVVGLSLPQGHASHLSRDNRGDFNWARMTQVVDIHSAADLNEEFLLLIGTARDDALTSHRSHSHYGVSLKDLLDSGIVIPETLLTLTAGKRDITTARLGVDGAIVWNGTAYASPSDKAFAALLGPDRTSLNGWTHWYVGYGSDRRSLADLRREFLQSQGVG